MLSIPKKTTLSLKAKLLVFIFTSTTVILLSTIGYLSYNTAKTSLNEAEEFIQQVASKNASQISASLNADLSMVVTLGSGFSQMLDFKQQTRDSVTQNILKNVIHSHKHILSLWLHWELNQISSNYAFGRVRSNYYRQNSNVNYKTDTIDRAGDNTKDLYYQIKTSVKNVITEPYFYSYSGTQEESIHEVSLCSPVIYKGKFAGLLGVDIALSTFDEQIRKIKPFESGYAFFVSNQGVFISHPKKKNIGRNILEDFEALNEIHNFGAAIKNGLPIAFYRENDDKTVDYVCFAPVFVGDTETPWSLGIVVPQEIILSRINDIYTMAFIISVLGLAILLLLIYWLSLQISRPLIEISNVIGQLAMGEIKADEKMVIDRKDEIGQIAGSVNLLTQGMVRMASFAREIGEGNLEVDYQLLGERDIMGLSLLEMQKNLKKARDEEQKRRKDEEIQNWINHGLALANEVLRKQDMDIRQHAYQALKVVVDYVKANQGVLFVGQEIENPIDEEENKEFLAIAALAWGRKRSITKAYKMGEALVGRCAFERTTLYLSQVPQNYVNITSGLGKANPNYLLLVPLKMNEDIMGVLEIASFNPISAHEKEFIEKVSFSIASTVAGKQVSERTARLLEQTKLQAEELVQKEEEMRQNIEEMQATQEEFAKREAEIDSVLEAVNSLAFVFHFDMSGNYLYVNENFSNFIGIAKNQLVGRNFNSLDIDIEEPEELSNSDLWDNLFNGEKVKLTRTYNFPGASRKLTEVYCPVMDREGIPVKIICIAFDATAND